MEDYGKTINQIREFNRFYTVLLGFLNQKYLNSEYSITETRILFELKEHKQISANRLIEMLHLDKSYISRLIRNFEHKGLITRKTAAADRRALLIQLTSKGQEETEKMIAITNDEIGKLVGQLNPETCHDLCRAMETIMNILSINQFNREKSHEN